MQGGRAGLGDGKGQERSLGFSSSFVSSAILAYYAYSGSTTSERMAREKRPLEKYAFKDGMPEEKRQRPQLARSVLLCRTIYPY